MANLVTSNDSRQVVVITGCSSGLGRSMALEFDAQKDFRVFATARNLDSIRELPAGIERVQLDVTDQKSIDAAFKKILKETDDRIDILVNNAGVNLAVGPLIETPIDDIRKTFDANVSTSPSPRPEVNSILMIPAVWPAMPFFSSSA